jgi:altronate dehydratase
LKQKAVLISPKDNVATALVDLRAGDTIELTANREKQFVKLVSEVPFGHKFSVTEIPVNALVIKYGEAIGLSATPIKPGEHVHTHNVVSARGRGDLEGSER